VESEKRIKTLNEYSTLFKGVSVNSEGKWELGANLGYKFFSSNMREKRHNVGVEGVKTPGY